MKLAKQATGRPNVIVFSGSFHGRTHLTMAMTTSKTGYRGGYAPLPAGVFVAPFPDPLAADEDAEIDARSTAFDHLLASQTAPAETAAIIIEPVLGEGGYIPAPARVPARPRDALRASTGSCSSPTRCRPASHVPARCSRSTHAGVEPDVLCMAKGIASGFPFSALGARAEIMARWPKGSHGGTYGGNPIGCAAALATIEVMTEPGFLDNVNARGAQLRSGLAQLAASDDRIRASARSRADERERVRRRRARATRSGATASSTAGCC